jgi:transcriptional regulator with XRE-family HTH domain
MYICQYCQDTKREENEIYRTNQAITRRLSTATAKLAVALEIDTATYSKIEKGERRVKAEQIVVIAEILKANKEDLISFVACGSNTDIVIDEHEVAIKALEITKNKI